MASKQQVALVVGASRGIGRQVAIDLAKNGYTVVVAAKSTSDALATNPFPPDPNSQQSTVSTVEREIKEAGGQATAIAVDTRDFESLQRMVDETVKLYGHIDVLVYNSGAIWWASVEKTPMKRFQLMQRINVEGLYGTIQAALPHFKNQSWKARIIVVSPPIYSRFFRGKTAYAMGKIGMSVLTKGLAMDWEREGKNNMAITSIWPASSIESAATQRIQETDPDSVKDLRSPAIYSDAILAMLRAPVADVNGLIDTDEDFLRSHEGVTDFSKYSVVPGATPRRIMPAKFPDLTVAEQADEGQRTDSMKMRKASKL
ncbi:Hydroxysteroid dehydrogenase-like protein [Lachnellula occidentalis]|uniref:Hydroxysteroid dehydrogenase-like protein n=1 Tax=Lachnellula occidentalis TaxID=215460 RepID=A0A8H8RMP6_9HELO|nr:Hydroxysteroid dehydrogenase-like protein [Lachnellula occidentalis]